ncbi:nitroreductase family deazaflavin-dependent oxidoreductase [Aldersonia kunmingensis]|uniref:nitroreductase family deazaflavin-dependent oxidoreductase n=1 Tax=Aldersonia kunmingensis TaxID=408066 RepID=UPI0008337930|nr:nitroreductase family deazaflavin-dependent oxidoreductase [Aldersonia kunmingensis]
MGPLPRLGRYLGSRTWVMRFGPAIKRIEQTVRGVTGGRYGVLDIAGLPSVQITVLGRKSGLPRTTSVLCVPDGDTDLVIGSNFGGHKHPGWSANLMEADAAAVRRNGTDYTAVPELLTGADREQAWEYAVAAWPGYQMEANRAAGREFRIFRLRYPS